jgi:hypothetical protein
MQCLHSTRRHQRRTKNSGVASVNAPIDAVIALGAHEHCRE